ncbi:fasciclin-like arabinogalactan protein 1 [Aristolochia californica]|uniref:fasciclin-like arabinogalactan protein 1 n=1 Tax=Aristolochia californica TaxID=171875 RepID=UPI0035D860D0
MQLSAALVTLFLSLVLLSSAASAHNITRILAKHPEFSTFNHYLTTTHLAPEINRKETITILALDNSAMSAILAKGLPIATIKNILSLHILLDYFGAKKLHQITNGTALSATMYQATGSAPGSSGFVNITDLKGGKVGFGAEDNNGVLDASFVKSVQEIPYNISVIQISHPLSSPEAEAPTPSPVEQNLTAILGKKGCKNFADLLASSGALKTFEDNLPGGLTVFCPGDEAIKKFAPKYKNLTAEGKASVLLFHGVPIYQSMAMLKSNNGLMNTLATDGAKKFDFTVQNEAEDVTLKTKINTAKITGTVIDDEPLVAYTLDTVLLPKELFKAEAPSPAPAPAPEADSPAESPKRAKKAKAKAKSPPAPDVVDAPADAPSDDSVADDDSGAMRVNFREWPVALGIVMWLWM